MSKKSSTHSTGGTPADKARGDVVAEVCATSERYSGSVTEVMLRVKHGTTFATGTKFYTHPAPAPDAVGRLVEDGENVEFHAAFFVSKDGNRVEQLTSASDYHREPANLALMDLGQKRASEKGLTKKGAGKVVLAWVRAPFTAAQQERK